MLKTIYELLPERLAALRDERKLTQQAAADLCEMPLRTYVGFEYGERFPRGAHLVRLCKGFGVDQDYFCSNGGVIEKEHSLPECLKRVSEAAMGAPSVAPQSATAPVGAQEALNAILKSGDSEAMRRASEALEMIAGKLSSTRKSRKQA